MEKMKIIMESERLFFRELTSSDSRDLAKVLSNPVSMKYYPHPFSKAEVDNWISWNINNYRNDKFGLWALILKTTNTFIGDCGITLQNIDNEILPEIGYHIIPSHTRQGYASEAAAACANHAFSCLNFPCIYSYMKNDNIPSRKVAERIGMKQVKTFSKIVMDCVVQDEVLYKLEKQ
jgi:RimJ/RimL family protein N-acetyltransferase